MLHPGLLIDRYRDREPSARALIDAGSSTAWGRDRRLTTEPCRGRRSARASRHRAEPAGIARMSADSGARSGQEMPGLSDRTRFFQKGGGGLRISLWCPWPESNQHSLRNSILSRARLPVPPQGHSRGRAKNGGALRSGRTIAGVPSRSTRAADAARNLRAETTQCDVRRLDSGEARGYDVLSGMRKVGCCFPSRIPLKRIDHVHD